MLDVPKEDRFAPVRDGRLYANLTPNFEPPQYIDSVGLMLLSLEGLQSGAQGVMMEYNEQLSDIPIALRPKDAQARIFKTMSSIGTYMGFGAAGRNIFAIAPGLAEEFEHTDVAEAQFDDLFLPYSQFYVGFGPRTSLPVGDGSYIDGAYIEHKADEIHVQLSSYDPKMDYSSPMNLTGKIPYAPHFHIPVKLGTTISSGIEAMLEKEAQKRAELNARPAMDPVTFENNGRMTTVEDVRPKNDQIRAREFDEATQLLRSSLNLIVNSLCFVSSFPKQIDHQYRAEIPSELLRDAENKAPANRKEKRAKAHAMRVMEAEGYSKIHWCHDELPGESPDGPATGREVSTHWRKGHWRRQPHGPGMTQCRLIRIRPTLVRRDKADPVRGHVYEINPGDIPSVPKVVPDVQLPSSGTNEMQK